VPIWLSETQGSIRHRAPTIGEHTDRVMSSLGYTPAEIEALKGRGVI
jgi:crotonobetainyl-CoA:carnitine CoA-transferase CaiB-like acyl-CoA transferase